MHQAIRRRALLKAAAGSTVAALGAPALAQSFAFQPNLRYPDPAVQMLDPGFARYRIDNSTLEQVASGMRWAEGPVWFPEDGGHVVVSDIPNNRLMKYSERDGKLTVLADSFEGRKLNAPNDIVCKSDDSLWFTDPLFGINGEWEGSKAKPEQAGTNVYRLGADGRLSAVITDLVNPNGLAFSPDEKKLYVVEWKGTPNRSIWAYDVGADGSLANKTKLIDAADHGALDGFKVDRDGNLWCGWGSNGALQGEPVDVGGRKVYTLKGRPEDLDGVMVFNPQGKPIGFIRLPERCANLCFGGPKRNRLYMASCHSLYALYVESHAAV